MQNLQRLRMQIKKIDALIIKALVKRQAISREIGNLKAEAGEQVVDLQREKKLKNYHQTLCELYGIRPELIQQLFDLIITDSRTLQK